MCFRPCRFSQSWLFSLQSSTPPTEASKEIITSAEGSENFPSSSETSCVVSGVSLPTIVITSCETPEGDDEETEKEPHPCFNSDSSIGSCAQEKGEDSENPLTHFKMILRGLTRSRSQESLASLKNHSDEEASRLEYASPSCSREGGLHGEDATNGPSWLHFNARLAHL